MRDLLPLGTVQRARPANLLQFLLELDDPLLQQTPVSLDLRFARPPHEACAAPLPFQVGPAADETALLVVQMGEVDLQDAFPCRGALAEYLQDQAGPVDDLRRPCPFQVALLDRGKRMIDDHQPGVGLLKPRRDLLHLARAEERSRPGPGHRHQLGADDVEVDRLCEADRLLQARFSGPRGRRGRRTLIAGRVSHDHGEYERAGTPGLRAGPGLKRRRFPVVGNLGQPPCQAPPPDSSCSNICMGWPGMMVEIACL